MNSASGAAGRITLEQVVGGYPEETEGPDSFRWTDSRLEYRYRLAGGGPARVRARFACLPATPQRRLQISVVDSVSRPLQTIDLKEGWNTVTSELFEATQLEFSLVFQCDQPPVRLTPTDPRMLAFRIKDLDLNAYEMSQIFKKMACPVCLGALTESNAAGGTLVCHSCSGVFAVQSGLPILLLDDENRRIKADEIKGEVEFNIKKVPPEVHQARNAFADQNTEIFLREAGISIAGQEVLIVGCSMAELLLCARNGAKLFCLDIVPTLTLACHKATAQVGVEAGWVCGDGECLPFQDESFDVVMVRQVLHHMLKYYSAISEFFRVLRIGGAVLIVDEPFCTLAIDDPLLNYPTSHHLYGGITVGNVRETLGIASAETLQTVVSDLTALEYARDYIAVDDSDPERLLADKYHSFSLLNCISALQMHTEDYDLLWPREVGWADEGGAVMEFQHGPSPLYSEPLLKKLISQGNVSIVARKSRKTSVFRDRRGVRPMPLDVVWAMLGGSPKE
jgi:SAM-dependent methyltransferase